MRVGLLFSNPHAKVGGALTFEQELFRAFVRISGESAHHFHIICEPGVEHDSNLRLPLPGNVSITTMPTRTSRWAAKSLIRRLVRRGARSARTASRESRAVSAQGIEFLLSLGHYEHEVFDTPYMTIVLDLQHRLQPWFPEVSRSDLWRLREDYFFNYLSRAAFVITGTKRGRREIEHFYRVPRDRIRVLPLPTPQYCLEAADEDPKPRLRRLGIDRRYLFYPAQFWPHKNHVNLLHALHLLNNVIGEEFDLVFAGADRGNEHHVRKTAEALRLQDHVRNLGFVDQDDLIALYQGAFALAFVTYFGPDNLPPLEAFALGCPVISSDVPGAREQLRDAPLFVNPSDPGDIAAAVKRLCEEPDLRPAMVGRGRQFAKGWTTVDYMRGIFTMLDEFEAVRRTWP